MPLSVSIICKNNQASIGRTLASVSGLADEIVAVDSGSTDGTIAMLEAANARIVHSPWLGYVRTKQLALDECRGDWILSLDSDESLLPDLAESVRAVMRINDPAVAGYRVNRRVFYRDRPLRFAWQPEWRLRLVRKGRAKWGGLDPHDGLEMIDGGCIENLNGDLRHDSFPSFSEWLPKATGHARLSAQTNFAAGRRSGYASLLFSPPAAFLKQLVLKQAWRDGWPGWLAAGSVAAYVLMKHMVLIELEKTRDDGAMQEGTAEAARKRDDLTGGKA
ncbi:MAG: glycosyltransferase family 2 protein [Phycisphaeraceae bacterium]|nr:glycosyltransferase family 2 protein [Phycisphaeraceae bacterium]